MNTALVIDNQIRRAVGRLKDRLEERRRRSRPPAAAAILRMRDGLVCCRVCSCTERQPCEPPCGWDQVDLCTGCAATVDALVEWVTGAHRPNKAALFREVSNQVKTEGRV